VGGKGGLLKIRLKRVMIKMLCEGQPCRTCGKPVKRVERRKENVKKTGKWYWPSYLYCFGCKKHYTVNSEKVLIKP